MSVTFERTFRVRHYECDAYENLFYTSYLRYIQETAMDASAAAGFGTAYYSARGTIWLVRDTEIEYVHPARYGDSVVVKTWVVNVRKVLSKRAYELRFEGSGDIIARAATDWAYLDIANGRPTRIPDEIRAGFFPEGDAGEEAGRDRFPEPAPPLGAVFTQRRHVGWRDIDPAQHVNNSAYLAYAEDCEVEASTAAGWPPSRMREEGFAIVVRKHRIEYRQAAVLSDELDVATWVSDGNRDVVTRHYTITRVRDNLVLARARAEMACVDARNADISRNFPDAYRTALVSDEHKR